MRPHNQKATHNKERSGPPLGSRQCRKTSTLCGCCGLGAYRGGVYKLEIMQFKFCTKILCFSVFKDLCRYTFRHCKRPMFLTSNYWEPYMICSLIFKKWHRFCRARICRFISPPPPARNIPPPPSGLGAKCSGGIVFTGSSIQGAPCFRGNGVQWAYLCRGRRLHGAQFPGGRVSRWRHMFRGHSVQGGCGSGGGGLCRVP